MQETKHKLLCLNSFLFKLFIDLHPSTGQAEDPFCVHIFTLRHFRLVSELDDPALHFHLCLLPAIVTSVVVCRQPPPSHLSPTIPRSRSSLSTRPNPGGFEVILFVCIFSHSNISGWYQSGTILLCTSISVYRRPLSPVPSFATSHRCRTYPRQYPNLGCLFQRISTRAPTSFSSACIPCARLQSPELQHNTWVLVAGLFLLCFSHQIVVLVLSG